MIITVVLNCPFSALASGESNVVNAKVKAMVLIGDESYIYYTTEEDENGKEKKVQHKIRVTDTGGISINSAENGLYVVKCSDDEKAAVLLYYDNIYNEDYKIREREKRKFPKCIFFVNDDNSVGGILAHANAMAIDDKYIYVTKWGKETNSDKSTIVRISREQISKLKTGRVVTKNDNKNRKTGALIYKELTPVTSDGKPYTTSILQITRYDYDEKNNAVKFIINRGNSGNGNSTTRKYGLATYYYGTNNFVVSDEPKDNFKVKYTFVGNTYNGKKNFHIQDICYSKTYGLLIPIWYENVTEIKNAEPNSDIRKTIKYKCYNRILVVDISNALGNSSASKPPVQPRKIVTVIGNADFNKYELESLSIVNRDSKKIKLDKPRIVFSANTSDTDGDCDRLGMITNSGSILS